MIFCYLRGATAYELQIGQVVWRWVHLSCGGCFKWYTPWRRFSVKRYPKEQA